MIKKYGIFCMLLAISFSLNLDARKFAYHNTEKKIIKRPKDISKNYCTIKWPSRIGYAYLVQMDSKHFRIIKEIYLRTDYIQGVNYIWDANQYTKKNTPIRYFDIILPMNLNKDYHYFLIAVEFKPYSLPNNLCRYVANELSKGTKLSTICKKLCIKGNTSTALIVFDQKDLPQTNLLQECFCTIS